ncbi:YtxH domain-containing protein [Priestia sp. Y58]|uniref:YtxH domain-containing protein n=1 Tax=Priestia TaxID=2800373 RepID=UPI001C8EBFE7|nr:MULTISPECIES: YtxH domain-containing protein [Priestia]MBX9988678.1 YtxH domain-containing protein [Priestia aryabhattai]MBY0002793.1 YtxH domain-containing protein [Priestia aryabhattai]MCZ8497150.1 YtxH domain-containing protein [Priestia megaterium]MDG0032280.1 YtxH domain-containing protein [Priestia sp. Y58]MDG0061728.1 YtxH domain-containing protein [Priestia sp. P5]
MGKRNKLVEGIVIGAIIGGAVSLFDKETRSSVIQGSKKLKDKTTNLIQHPELVTDTVKEKYETIRTTIEQVSEDVSFVAGKVEKLKETTPQVMEIVNDTKEAFVEKYGDEQK